MVLLAFRWQGLAEASSVNAIVVRQWCQQNVWMTDAAIHDKILIQQLAIM